MFEFSRELKRLFTTDGPRDGLTVGNAPLLELLDLTLLRNEARAAEISAGRISAKDPAQRSLESARVWRELARRTGDAVALRKAAAAAERAAEGFERDGRTRQWAQARCEQAAAAMAGADLFGDEGLRAAARFALVDAREHAPGSAGAAIARGQLARLDGRSVLAMGDAAEVLAAAAAFDVPLAALEAQLRNRSGAKSAVVDLRCDRAELLLAAGSRLRDPAILQRAQNELRAVEARVDPTYEPIGWSRIQELGGAVLVALGEAQSDIELVAEGVSAMAEALDVVIADHSPLDWARLQHSLAVALRTLGEASDSERAFDQALGCFDRALWALKDAPGLSLRPVVAGNRAACLARRAELVGDLDGVEAAVANLKSEVASLSPTHDPVQWAVCQVNLARLYEARMGLRGERRGEAAATALALNAALEVFAEQGLRTLSDEAARGLQRLADRNRSRA